MILCDRHHNVSQSAPFFTCHKTVTILLRIKIRGHFVMSFTKHHEAHCRSIISSLVHLRKLLRTCWDLDSKEQLTELIKPVPLHKSMEFAPVGAPLSYWMLLQVLSDWFPDSNGTVSFLQVFGRLYNSFGIEAHSTGKAAQVSLQNAVKNVAFVNHAITKTVSEVKQKHRIKESVATNGPEGAVSSKTLTSLTLLEKGMRQLNENVTSINKDYLEDVELCTLLPTVVENLSF